MYPDSFVPAIPTNNDRATYEFGVKFTTSTDGYVNGIRFYKGTLNTGTHVGNLWTIGGKLLRSATFTNESATGWQTVTFASPVPISANTVYVASYFAPKGGYAYASPGFTSAMTNGPLTFPADGTAGSGYNAVYRQIAATGSSIFPTFNAFAQNYFVDLVFQPGSIGIFSGNSSPPTVTAVSPSNGATNVTIGGAVDPTTGIPAGVPITATLDKPLDPATVNSNTVVVRDSTKSIVQGSVSYDPLAMTITFTPVSTLNLGATYTVTLSGGAAPAVADAAENFLAQSYSWSFTTGGLSLLSSNYIPPMSIWSSSAVPSQVTSATDTGRYELGVKFQSQVAGYITGVRFYKGALNTGTHSGSLWSRSGTRLATGTFTNETVTGWQTLTFAAPVAIQANTTYVASYFCPNGGYAYDLNYLTTGFRRAPLVLLGDGGDGPNGVYKPIAANGTSGFPASGAAGTNYYIDVVFTSNPNGPTQTAPLSALSDSAVPSKTATTLPIEVGVKFQASFDGYVSALRFYKPAGGAATHNGHLWTSHGVLLTEVAFQNETASGWQRANFPFPIPVAANTTYVASYFSGNGVYAFDLNYFLSSMTSGPLTFLADGTDGGNGVYSFSGGFPSLPANATNFWVDVVYAPIQAPH